MIRKRNVIAWNKGCFFFDDTCFPLYNLSLKKNVKSDFIWDCRDFALPLSLNGSENSSHSLSQSDAELNQ